MTRPNYTHWMPAGGVLLFLPVVDEQPVKGADVHVRFVVLFWDELKVKEVLVFNKHTYELDVNNELAKIKQCR